MLNQTGVETRSFGAPEKTILVDPLNSTAVSVIVANTGVNADSEGKKIIKAGQPVYGSLQARNTPFIVPQTVDPTATATVVGTGVTAAAVVAATFSTAVSGESGSYEFVATVVAEPASTTWKLGNDTVTLSDYGITPTGSPANGDKITVEFVAGGSVTANAVVLHDVDVTSGNANSQVVIFGTIDVSKVDASVQSALISAESSLKMIQLVK